MPAETVCPYCGGTGWKIVERNDVSGAERCDCAFTARARHLEESAGIPPLYRNASLDTFVAYAPDVEDAILPQSEGIADAMEEILRW